MPLIDSHCHLALADFDADRAEVLARARRAGVVAVLDVGIGPGSWERTLALASHYPQTTASAPAIFAALGLHPNDLSGDDGQAMAQLTRLLSSQPVVAIGETGLDYHWRRTPPATQQALLQAHLELARRFDRPVIIHCREAYDDLLATLAKEGQGTRGVLHCFGGSLGHLEQALACGYAISLAGPVTFKKADDVRLIAAAVPADRLLIETDSPYLTPHPHRGQRNEPARVALVAAAVAAARGIAVEELIAQSGRNAAALFGLPIAV